MSGKCSNLLFINCCQTPHFNLLNYLPGDNSETGVLEGVGLCPAGRKWEGEPLLEPLPAPPNYQ